MTTVLERPIVAAGADTESVCALEVRNVSVSFPHPTRNGLVSAVNDISLTVGDGRILAILGESGSGKSVLLRTILGMQAPSARVRGEVLLHGTDLFRLSAAERTRLRGSPLSMVFQNPMTRLGRKHEHATDTFGWSQISGRLCVWAGARPSLQIDLKRSLGEQLLLWISGTLATIVRPVAANSARVSPAP